MTCGACRSRDPILALGAQHQQETSPPSRTQKPLALGHHAPATSTTNHHTQKWKRAATVLWHNTLTAEPMPFGQRVCHALVDARSPAMVAVFGSLFCGASKVLNSPPLHCEGDPEHSRRESTVGRKRARRDPPVNPCAKYNSLKWRMSYASRK